MRLLNNLRGHPKRTTHHSLALINGVRQFSTHAKISKLDVPIIRQQHIPTFDISVTHFLLMQILQSQDYSRTRRTDTFFGHGKTSPTPRRLDQITHAPSLAVLLNNPQFRRIQSFFGRALEAFEVSNDVGTVAFAQDVDFAHDFHGFLVALLIRDDFDGDDGAGGLVFGGEDLAEGAFAEHFLDFEFISAVEALAEGTGVLLRLGLQDGK
jgi:hypothetical protein